tara:strand:+ start:422 stop:1417 length:996 start_codon:yes stop_codon:yes gene_type:complete
MDSLDKFLYDVAYKFPKGYPDMNDPKDKDMLFKMIHEVTEEKSLLKEQQQEYDDRIKETLGVNTIPICNTSLEIGKDFNISGKDQEIWKKLFGVKPLAARTGKQSAGAGNGEVSTYWAFQYNKNKKFDVEDKRGRDNPDLIINGIGVEIKDYGSKFITLGKFFADKKSYGLLSNLFGFKSLLSALGGDFPKESASNPGTFKSKELVEAAKIMMDFKSQKELKQIATKYNFDLILSMFSRIDSILKTLGLNDSSSHEDVAAGILKVMISTKLKKKPMLQQDKGYILNVNVTGLGDFVEISDEKINSLSNEDLFDSVGVSSSEIKMNFDALFK